MKVGKVKKENEVYGNKIRVFDGTNQKDFLLKVINGEIKDSYNMEINANVKLKALQMYNEILDKEESMNKNKGSEVKVVIGDYGDSFDEGILSKPLEIDRVVDNRNE